MSISVRCNKRPYSPHHVRSSRKSFSFSNSEPMDARRYNCEHPGFRITVSACTDTRLRSLMSVPTPPIDLVKFIKSDWGSASQNFQGDHVWDARVYFIRPGRSFPPHCHVCDFLFFPCLSNVLSLSPRALLLAQITDERTASCLVQPSPSLPSL